MAERLGKTYVAFGSWERAERCPSADDARAWADALGVDWPANADSWFRRHTSQLLPCGTRAAFQRHGRLNEEVDELCRAAENAYMRNWRAKRRNR